MFASDPPAVSLSADKTLIDLLRAHAERFDTKLAFGFLHQGESLGPMLSFAELWEHARRLGSALQKRVPPGARVLLAHPSGIEFVEAFFACLYAKVIAVPVHLPESTSAKRHLSRLHAIVKDCQPALALTRSDALERLRALLPVDSAPQTVPCLASDVLIQDSVAALPPQPVQAGDPALLIYTSGSTGGAKGAVITHANVLHNLHIITAKLGNDEHATHVTWLPLFHDLGLIVAMLGALGCGASCYLMDPADFVENPLRWLRAISHFRARNSYGPNFAFELCVRRARPAELSGLDLSCWRVALTGAEPVRAASMEQFVRTFGGCGFRIESFYPAYGMAEATAMVTGGIPGTAPRITTFDAHEFGQGKVVPAENHAKGLSLVGCGSPGDGLELAIVDPDTGARRAAGVVGEVWLRGASIGAGYFGQTEATSENFNAVLQEEGGSTYLRTGDLGFLHEGEFYISGRLKDLLIIHGVNHSPQDLEWTVERCHPALRPGGCVVFAVDSQAGEEAAVIAEVSAPETLAGTSLAEEILDAIRAAVADEHDLSLARIALVPPRAILKTTSGKLRRGAMRDALTAGSLPVLFQWQTPERLALPLRSGASSLEATAVGRLLELVQREASAVLGLAGPSAVAAEQPLRSAGLDSLRVVELRNQLETFTGVRLDLSAIWRSATPLALARELTERLAEGKALIPQAPPHPSGALPGAPTLHSRRAPASPGQRRLWFLDRVLTRRETYNVSIGLRLNGVLDEDLLRLALEVLISRHESLRTAIVEHQGEPQQRVVPWVEAPLHIHTLSPLPEPARAAALRELVAQQGQNVFDLAVPPLFRVMLVHVQPGESALILTWHHISTDGTSAALFVRELETAYLALAAGEEPVLPPALSYLGYSERASAWLQSEAGATERRFWQQQLAGLPELDLPTDHPPGRLRSQSGGVVRFALSRPLSEGLERLARDTGCTPFVVLCAAWSALLARYTGQVDFGIGTVVAGRTEAAIRNALGFFANTLPIRCQLHGEPNVLTYLARLREQIWAVLDHQDLPLDEILRTVCRERSADSSSNPLFQTCLVLEEESWIVQTFAGLLAAAITNSIAGDIEGTSRYDLSLALVRREDGFQASIEFSKDLFEAATIQRMTGHFTGLLNAMVATPQAKLHELPLLSEAERHQLLVQWSVSQLPLLTEREPLRTDCIHHLFEAHVDRAPDAVALVDLCGASPSAITYGQLEGRANQVAHHLCRLGVRPEMRVGVCLERGADLIVALLGIVKASGAFVVLDPEHPRPRLAGLLEDTSVPVLLTRGALLSGLPATRARVVDFDHGFASEPTHRPPSSVRPDNLAYVLYTSGSTGQPNGALIEHRGLVNSIQEHIRIMETTPGSRHVHILSFNFDGALAHLFTPICSGGTSYLAPRDGDFLGRGLLDLIERERLTHAAIPHSILALLPDAELPSLQTLVVGGERCSANLVTRWGKTRRFINMYGPTEASILATSALCVADGKPPPIGRPIANMQAYIADRWGQLAPLGTVGELWLGGIGVGRGYLNRPELTARKFIDNPFGPGRLYRTGDLVRYRPTDSGPPVIEFVGRADNQLKIRGYRVEPAEVENALRASTLVRDVVVTAYQGESLTAYVVPALGEPSSAWELDQVTAWDAVAVDPSLAGNESGSGEPDLTLDLRGWKSSYTGDNLPQEEMRVWAESTVERIVELGPREVLEIGCGTGMLLARIAPRVRRYRGTDLARHAIEHVERLKAKLPHLANVTVSQQPAHDFSGLAGEVFDTIILNSVVQYFPSGKYLFNVIKGLLGLMPPTGAIFLGDIRNLALLEMYHASVEQHRESGTRSRKELLGRVQRAMVRENELLVHPHFFNALRTAFPQITEVEITPKRGHYRNELSLFRYDVTLRIGAVAPPRVPIEWRDAGKKGITADEIRSWIRQSAGPRALGLRSLENARLQRDRELVQWLHAEDERLLPGTPSLDNRRAWDPEELWSLESELPCRIHLSWAAGRPDGSLDAIVTTGALPLHSTLEAPPPSADFSDLTNDPLLSRRYREVAAELNRELRETLPPHLIPSAVVVLPALPLTLNGKVDLRALPPPQLAHEVRHESAAPRTADEHKLAEIWGNVLGLPKIGIHDNFFALGGHSLLAVTMMSRVAAEFGQRIPLSDLFQTPTIEALALRLTRPLVNEEKRSGIVTTIRSHGDRPPVFFFAPFGLHGVYLNIIGQKLGEQYPFYVTHPMDVVNQLPDVTSVDLLADRIADAIQQVRPAGPYVLSGYSAGVRLALPVAIELEARGQRTTLLSLDMSAPRPGHRYKGPNRDIVTLVRLMNEEVDGGLGIDLEALGQLAPDQAWRTVADDFVRLGLLPPGSGAELLQRALHVDERLERTVVDYLPGVPYSGRLIVLWAAHSSPVRSLTPQEGWQELCKHPLQTFTVPGNHFSMVREPNLTTIVEHLRRVADEAAAPILPREDRFPVQ